MPSTSDWVYLHQLSQLRQTLTGVPSDQPDRDNASSKSLHGDSRLCQIYKGKHLRIQPISLSAFAYWHSGRSSSIQPHVLHVVPETTKYRASWSGPMPMRSLYGSLFSVIFLWCAAGVESQPCTGLISAVFPGYSSSPLSVL